jgi:hypothetical protein
MINLPQTNQVPNNCLLGNLYQEEFGYCYQSANVITLRLAQSDHIKRPPLYFTIYFYRNQKYSGIPSMGSRLMGSFG